MNRFAKVGQEALSQQSCTETLKAKGKAGEQMNRYDKKKESKKTLAILFFSVLVNLGCYSKLL
jgi:hypothetical protein